jgi:hypothetical protein
MPLDPVRVEDTREWIARSRKERAIPAGCTGIAATALRPGDPAGETRRYSAPAPVRTTVSTDRPACASAGR